MSEQGIDWDVTITLSDHVKIAGQDVMILAIPIDVSNISTDLLASRMMRAASTAEEKLRMEDPQKLEEEAAQSAKMREYNSRPGNVGAVDAPYFHHPWVKDYRNWSQQLPKP